MKRQLDEIHIFIEPQRRLGGSWLQKKGGKWQPSTHIKNAFSEKKNVLCVFFPSTIRISVDQKKRNSWSDAGATASGAHNRGDKRQIK